MTPTPPRFGVNYVPGTGWWYCWTDWDDTAVLADLHAVAALGCDHVRVQCLWPVFQPNPTLVSPTALDRLTALLDHADTAGLDVVVTVLDGWLSGFDFRPAWLGDGINMFTDPAAVRAEHLLISALADRIAAHRRFLGFDVANEPSVLATDIKNVTTTAQGDRWTAEILAHCTAVAPGKQHCLGMDHTPWLTDDKPFSRSALATTGSLTPVHAWVYFTGALARYGETGTGATHLVEYMLELAKAHHSDPARPVWLQEYGISPGWLAHPDPAGFAERVTTSVLTVADLWGVTWWCSHDIHPGLSGFDPHEYDMGLLTVDNEVKPAGRRFAEVVRDARGGRHPLAVPRPTAVVLPDGRTPDLAFADAFFRVVDDGGAPAIVLQSRAGDPEHLAARGITELVVPG